MAMNTSGDLAKPYARISWFGHAMFLVEDDRGMRLVTDPFDPQIGYGFPEMEASVVLVSHEHFDHNYVGGIKGSPVVIKGVGENTVGGMKIEGIPSFHDSSGGKERGENVIYLWELAGLSFVHLGDLGHVLSADVTQRIRGVDVLFVPVGGTFTIDARVAARLVKEVAPHVAIPMHFKTPALGFPIAGVDPFVAEFEGVERVGKSSIYLNRETLPEATRVVVLDYLE